VKVHIWRHLGIFALLALTACGQAAATPTRAQINGAQPIRWLLFTQENGSDRALSAQYMVFKNRSLYQDIRGTSTLGRHQYADIILNAVGTYQVAVTAAGHNIVVVPIVIDLRGQATICGVFAPATQPDQAMRSHVIHLPRGDENTTRMCEPHNNLLGSTED
jgi:hypothetical protein